MSRASVYQYLKNISCGCKIKVFFAFLLVLVWIEVYILYRAAMREAEEYLSYFQVESDELFEDDDFEHPMVGDSATSEDALLEGDRWQVVRGTRHKFYVYSAHHDSRLGNQIRIIGTTRPYGVDRVLCQLFYKDSSAKYKFVPATVKPTREDVRHPLTTVTVTCPLPDSSVPSYVSVVSASLPLTSNSLRVHGLPPPPSLDDRYTIAACVQPIDNYYKQSSKLIEFIEMNMLLGVSYFVFYNQSMSEEVSCLLKDYRKQGIATVMQWNFDMWAKIFHKRVHTETGFAAMNDCIYRTYYRFSFVTFLSLDEFIVPRNTNTLQHLIRSQEVYVDTIRTAAYSFKKVHFYLDWPDRPWQGQNLIGDFVRTIYKTFRTDGAVEVGRGQQVYVCRPESVLKIGALFEPTLVAGYEVVRVDQSAALCHKYCTCDPDSDDCTQVTPVVDETAHKHAEVLSGAMIARWNRAMPICSLHSTAPNDTPELKLQTDGLYLV